MTMIFRIKRYSAVDLLAGLPKWEYFTEENNSLLLDKDNSSPFEETLIEKARNFRDTLYSYDSVYGMAHKKGKLQAYVDGKWRTVK